MKNVLHIAGREMRAYFSSPLAYAVSGVFMLISGYLFAVSLKFFLTYYFLASRNPQMLEQLNINEMILRPLMHNLSIVMLFIMPILTMRLVSEEKRHQTIELLMTSPLTTFQIALGKYLGGLGLFTVMVLLTLPFPATLLIYGRPDPAPMALAYLGFYLIGATFLAVGLVASSVTKNQIIAALMGFGLLLLLWLLNWAGEAISGPIGEVLNHLSISEHLEDLTKGVFDSKHVIYFLTMIFTGIVVSQQAIDAHRWR